MIRHLATPAPLAQKIAADLRQRASLAAAALRHRWSDVTVRLFGSVAKGTCHAHSDIDLVAYNLPASAVLTAWQAAEAAAGTEAIDVVRFEECPPDLRQAIDAESVPA